MPDVKNKIIWTLQDEVSATSKRLKGELDGLGVKAKGTGGILGTLAGVTGGLVSPQMLAIGGATALAGGLYNAGKAAAAEQVNIAQLGASLEANVKNWDGNTAAIEAQIKEREKLGFTDDELRNSLARLVAVTKDEAKAWDLQNTAMDLARFAHVDLATASEALVKVEGGSFRILKGLVGSTKDITTSEQALAAVRKVAAGQRETYAKTDQASLDRLAIAADDLNESIGGLVVGPMGDLADMLVVVAGGADTAAQSLEGLGKTTHGLSDDFVDMVTTAFRPDKLLDFAHTAQDVFNDIVLGQGATKEATRDATARIVGDLDRAGGAFDDLAGDADRAKRDVGADMRQIATDARKMRGDLVTEAQRILNEYWGPQETRAELAATKIEIAELRKVRASGSATREQKAQLVDLQHKQMELEAELVGYAGASSSDISKTIHNMQLAWQKAGVAERADIDATIQKLTALALKARAATGALLGTGQATTHLNLPGQGGRAVGGPIWRVAEHQDETIHMTGPNSATVLADGGARGRAMAGGGVGGAPVTIQVTLDGAVLGTIIDERLYWLIQRATPTLGRT